MNERDKNPTGQARQPGFNPAGQVRRPSPVRSSGEEERIQQKLLEIKKLRQAGKLGQGGPNNLSLPAPAAPPGVSKKLIINGKPVQKLLGDWAMMTSSKGRPYYFHLKTQKSQWVKPEDWKSLEQAKEHPCNRVEQNDMEHNLMGNRVEQNDMEHNLMGNSVEQNDMEHNLMGNKVEQNDMDGWKRVEQAKEHNLIGDKVEQGDIEGWKRVEPTKEHVKQSNTNIAHNFKPPSPPNPPSSVSDKLSSVSDNTENQNIFKSGLGFSSDLPEQSKSRFKMKMATGNSVKVTTANDAVFEEPECKKRKNNIVKNGSKESLRSSRSRSRSMSSNSPDSHSSRSRSRPRSRSRSRSKSPSRSRSPSRRSRPRSRSESKSNSPTSRRSTLPLPTPKVNMGTTVAPVPSPDMNLVLAAKAKIESQMKSGSCMISYVDRKSHKGQTINPTWMTEYNFPAVLSRCKFPKVGDVLQELSTNRNKVRRAPFLPLGKSAENSNDSFEVTQKIRRDVFIEEVKNSNNRNNLISEKIGRTVYKISDDMWEQNFNQFQIDLLPGIKLEARPHGVTIDSIPVYTRTGKVAANIPFPEDIVRCHAVVQLWQSQFCHLVYANKTYSIERDDKQWQRDLEDCRKFLKENGY